MILNEIEIYDKLESATWKLIGLGPTKRELKLSWVTSMRWIIKS